MPEQDMITNLVFVGFSGGSCSTLSLPVEIFQHAQRISTGPGSQIAVVTPDGSPLNRHGFFSVKPTVLIEELDSPSLIFLTGMDLDVERSLPANNCISPWLKDAHSNGVCIAAVCPSQALLAEAGILESSAIHWSLLDTFKKRWPEVNWRADDMITASNNVVTCCGGTASTDLALYLVNELYGEDVMLECARWFLADTPRIRQDLPPPLFEMPNCTDKQMKQVQNWLQSHFGENFTFEDLANQFGMSPRNFYRKFKEEFGYTPRVYLQKLRTAAAKRLLESDIDTIDNICRQVGYEDPIFFRKIFKRNTSLTPSAYRDKFRFRSLAGSAKQ